MALPILPQTTKQPKLSTKTQKWRKKILGYKMYHSVHDEYFESFWKSILNYWHWCYPESFGENFYINSKNLCHKESINTVIFQFLVLHMSISGMCGLEAQPTYIWSCRKTKSQDRFSSRKRKEKKKKLSATTLLFLITKLYSKVWMHI